VQNFCMHGGCCEGSSVVLCFSFRMRLFRVNTALKEGCVSVIVLLAVLQLNSAKTLTKITEENCEGRQTFMCLQLVKEI